MQGSSIEVAAKYSALSCHRVAVVLVEKAEVGSGVVKSIVVSAIVRSSSRFLVFRLAGRHGAVSKTMAPQAKSEHAWYA